MALNFNISNLTRALSFRNFRIFVAGNVVSLIGTWMHRVATGWLTWELTHSAGWLGVMAFADLFPAVVIAPFAGVMADRWDRLRMMKIAQSLGCVLAAILAILYFSGAVTVWVLLAITLLLGIMDSFVQPFRLAFVAALVPKAELTTAVALKSVVFNLARFLGPAVAGIVIATSGVGLAFALNAATFALFLTTLFMIRLEPAVRMVPGPGMAKVTIFGDAMQGIRYTLSSSGIGAMLALLGVTCLTGRPVVELLPGWAGEIFSGSAADLAALTSSIGIGAVIGGIWLGGRAGPAGLTRIMVFCCLGLTVSLVAFSSSTSTLVALPTMAITGFFLVSSAICAQTLIQMNVEDSMRGRVLSVYAVILRGGPALGALLMGFSAEYLGLRIPLIVGAAAMLAAAIFAFTRLKTLVPSLEGKFQ